MKKITRMVLVLEKDDITLDKFSEVIQTVFKEVNKSSDCCDDYLFVCKENIITDMDYLFEDEEDFDISLEDYSHLFLNSFGIKGLTYKVLYDWYNNYGREMVLENPEKFTIKTMTMDLQDLFNNFSYEDFENPNKKINVTFNKKGKIAKFIFAEDDIE